MTLRKLLQESIEFYTALWHRLTKGTTPGDDEADVIRDGNRTWQEIEPGVWGFFVSEEVANLRRVEQL